MKININIKLYFTNAEISFIGPGRELAAALNPVYLIADYDSYI